MSSPKLMLEEALQLHQRGDYRQAERLYRQVIDAEPRNANAHHLLGLVAMALGEPGRAAEHIRVAIACMPNASQFHFHLGTALDRAGKKLEAVDSYRRATEFEPHSATMHNVLGSTLRDLGQAAEAEAAYRAAVRVEPTEAAGHNNLGNVLQDQGRYGEALAAFREAARLSPDLAEIHFNLGNCCLEHGDPLQAIEAYRRAVELKSDFAAAHHRLGLVLQAEKRYAEATEYHRRAIELEPRSIEAHNALGVALQMLDHFEDAKACYRAALAIDSGNVTAKYNLASALHTEARLEEAEPYYRAVIEAVPDHCDSLSGLGMLCMMRGDLAQASDLLERTLSHRPDAAEARFFHATLLLSQGKLREGWQDYEYRSQCRFGVPWQFDGPRWDGSPLDGKTLLVHAEYGFGDTIQFVRYDRMVRERARGSRVLLLVHPSMVRLLETSGFRDLLAEGGPLPRFDLQVPLMSLPGVFGTTLETIPGDVPYLFADSRQVAQWRARLDGDAGLKVGIHWQGNPKFAGDRHRSFPLAAFAPLAKVPGVRLFSLQKGFGREQLAQLGAGGFEVVDLADSLGDFVDTAAVMKNLDLVVTCDTAVGHLAGAMAVPVWVAISAALEWRWLRDRDDSPWYPTLRLFRQHKLGDWSGVFERIAHELAQLAAAGR